MEIALTLATVIALVVGLTQVVKQTNIISDRFIPVAVMFLALVVSIIVFKGISFEVVVSGLVAGLSSMGLWSGTKTVAGK
jgi:uncharacterized oligopeptide transporter (OPT) family protein